jgi:hypothetical protein
MLHAEEIATCLYGEDRKTLFVTLTNSGYLDYTLNMIESLKPLGLHVLSLCLDKECWSVLREKGHAAHLCFPDISGFATIDSPQFRSVAFYKLYLIGRILKDGYDVLYTDGDIVYTKDPFPYLFSLLDANPKLECIIQNDADPRGSSYKLNLCTGFFWIRATSATVHEFTFDDERIGTFNQYGLDQDFFNAHIRDTLSYHSLDQSLFPNGAYYEHVAHSIPDAYLLHFNFIIGHSKKYAMIQANRWYLSHETPRHTIKQMYLPQSPFWGLGDSLRGYFSLANLCKKYGFALEYDYSFHPISEWLENKHCTHIGIQKDAIPVYHIQHLKSLEQTFAYLATQVESATFVPLTTNTWYLADGIDEDTKRTLRESLIPNAELQECIDRMTRVESGDKSRRFQSLAASSDLNYDTFHGSPTALAVGDSHNLSSFSSLQMTHGDFSAVHIRMGDASLLRQETNQSMYNKLYEAIQQLNHSSLVVFSDDAALKDFLKERGIRVSPTVPVHLSDTNLERSRVKSTLVDFFCLSKASHIYTWSAHDYGSGFVDWCAELFTVPTSTLLV